MSKPSRKRPEKSAPAGAPAPRTESSLKQAFLGWYGVIGMTLGYVSPIKLPWAEGYAKDYWRHALASLLLVLMLLASGVGLVIYLVDANDFKDQIVDYVKTHKQRDLVLEGDIDITWFPKLGLDTGKLSLSQRNSGRKFASVDNARLYVAWWPLLTKRVQVERIVLDGVHANLVRHADGSTNFDDLLVPAEWLGEVEFAVEKVRVLDSSLNFQDEGSGRAAFVHELNLETGRLADATAGEVNARFRLQSVQPPLDLQMRLAGQLRYDHATRRYQVSSMEGHAQGEAGDVSELALEWRGTLTSLPQEHKLVLEPFNAVARGRLAQDRFEGRLAAARVQLVQGQWQAGGVSISASALRADATLAAELQAPGFEAGPQAWRSAQVQASVEFKRGEGTLQARLTTPVQYDAAARQLQLEAITGQGSATHPLLATRLDATLNGKLQAALDAQTVALEFKAAIDDSRFGGEVQLRDFRDPAWSFDLTSNILDVDRHLVSDWPGRLRERLQATDFEQLKALNLRGRLRSDELRMARLKASQLLAELRAGAGTLSVEPLGARLYGGSLDGGLSLVAGATPQLAVRHKLAGVQLDALLADLTGGEARLSGKGNISVDLQTQGATLDELRSGLRGTASLALARGTLAGLDLGEALMAAKEQIGLDNAVRSDSVRLTEHTPYTELRATLAFDAGQARSSDLLLRSPALALKGEGTFALDSGRLDAKLQASVAPGLRRASAGELAELAGISLPLQVSGPWATAVVRVEAGAASGGSAARLAKSNAARVVALAVPAAPPASAAAASAPASTTASAPVDTKTPSAPARPASGSRAAAR